jgi:MYXO-CTERM domain-containing protein
MSCWAVALAVVGFALPAYAYRTAADLAEFDGTEKVRWAEDRVEYVVNAELPRGLLLDDFVSTVQRAFDTWSKPECSLLSFRSAGVTLTPAAAGDGLNTVQWVTSGWADLGFAEDAAAVTDVQYEDAGDGTWVVAEADLYLNAELYEWVDEPAASNQQNLASVLTHEAGHVAGLLHSCEPGGAEGAPACDSDAGFAQTTMYPFYGIEQVTLAQDDIDGVCFLYAGSRCEAEGCRVGYECTPEGCRAECGDGTCAEGERCVHSACQPAEPPCDSADCPSPGCASDDECGPALRCNDGVCTPGAGVLGDACTSHRDCLDGACSESGACLATCVLDDECANGARCESNAGTRTCGNDGRAVGDACDSADDCAGRYCVADLSDSPVCSRACGAGAGCPSGWSCAELQGGSVCAPDQGEATACACSTPGTARASGLALLVPALLTFSALRRRRHRRRLAPQRISNGTLHRAKGN